MSGSITRLWKFGSENAYGILKFIFSLDQLLGSLILVLSIMAITDKKNKVSDSCVPIFIGLAYAGVGMSFGHNCGGIALNPARDFSPR